MRNLPPTSYSMEKYFPSKIRNNTKMSTITNAIHCITEKFATLIRQNVEMKEGNMRKEEITLSLFTDSTIL